MVRALARQQRVYRAAAHLLSRSDFGLCHGIEKLATSGLRQAWASIIDCERTFNPAKSDCAAHLKRQRKHFFRENPGFPRSKQSSAELTVAPKKRPLQVRSRSKQEDTLREYVEGQTSLDDVVHAIRSMMSTPEYQLTRNLFDS